MEKVSQAGWEIRKAPLGYILKHWQFFSYDQLKKKKLIFFCNTAWPQYALADQETCLKTDV